MAQVVAVLGKGVVDPSEPLLNADDLGVLRGDGVFETANVRAGEPWLLEEHLDRMAGSARRLEIVLPDAESLRNLASEACAEFGADAEGALRLICTRGPEAGGPPTVYATVNPVAESTKLARRDGVRLAGLSIGYAADARPNAPWLLGGAKCLSYATTMSVQRHAVASGADDALWISEDGYALEGPTSTLVWLEGDVLCTVPVDTGILFGTTAAYLLDHAHTLGLTVKKARVRPAELADVDGVWMTSSVRGVAEVHTLDMRQAPAACADQSAITVPSSPMTAKLQALAGFSVPS